MTNSDLPMDVPSGDGQLQGINNVSPEVWLDPSTAAAHAEQRRVELVQTLHRPDRPLGAQVDGAGQVAGDGVKAADQSVRVNLADGHGGTPQKPHSLSLTGWPSHLVTTLNRLHAADACVEGYGKLANYIRDNFAVTLQDFGMDREIPIALIVESNGAADAIWSMRNGVDRTPERDRFLRLLACDFAEHVLPIFEKRYPDDKRPRQCIEVTRRFAIGEATEEELTTARRAADAAADAAAAAAAYAAAADAAAAYAAYAAARLAEKQWQRERFANALAEELARCTATADQAVQRAGSEAVEIASGVFDVPGLES